MRHSATIMLAVLYQVATPAVNLYMYLFIHLFIHSFYAYCILYINTRLHVTVCLTSQLKKIKYSRLEEFLLSKYPPSTKCGRKFVHFDSRRKSSESIFSAKSLQTFLSTQLHQRIPSRTQTNGPSVFLSCRELQEKVKKFAKKEEELRERELRSGRQGHGQSYPDPNEP